MNIALYGRQYDFVAADARFAALIGGIGSGKSIGGAARALAAALGQCGPAKMRAPNIGVVTAPTYPMMRDATLVTFREIAGRVVTDFNKSEMRATLANGSEILFRSADNPDRLRGPNISWWWGDEAAYYHRDVWRVMIGRLRQYGAFGRAWVTTTPKGRNWLYQEFAQADRDTHVMFKVRTADNPFIEAAYYETLRASYAGDFGRQELDGDFVAFEGLVYPEFSQDAHVTSALPDTFRYHVAGVDWGYVHPGVINVYGVDSDGRMWLRHEEVARKRTIDEWVVAAQQLNATYRIETFYCDTAEPSYLQAFVDGNLNAVPATKDVLPGINAVKARLVVRGDGRPRLLYGAWCRHNIIEKEQYAWAEGRDGLREAVRKANDDCSDAERYAVMGVDGGGDGALFAGALSYESAGSGSLY